LIWFLLCQLFIVLNTKFFYRFSKSKNVLFITYFIKWMIRQLTKDILFTCHVFLHPPCFKKLLRTNTQSKQGNISNALTCRRWCVGCGRGWDCRDVGCRGSGVIWWDAAIQDLDLCRKQLHVDCRKAALKKIQ